MIWNQGPGVALGFFEDVGEPFQEILAVVVIEEDLSSLYSPGHDVLEKAGGCQVLVGGAFLFIVMFRYCDYFHSLVRQTDEDGSVFFVQTK